LKFEKSNLKFQISKIKKHLQGVDKVKLLQEIEMKTIFKTKELLKELNKINKIIKKYKWNESEKIILLNCERDNCYLKSIIPFIIKIKIPGEVIEPGKVFISIKNIENINKKYETVEISTDNNHIYFNNVSDKLPQLKFVTELSYFLFDNDYHYQIKSNNPNSKIENFKFRLENSKIKIEQTIDFCSMDKTKPMINCFGIQNNHIECTDGYRLLRKKNICEIPKKLLELGFSLQLPLEVAEIIKGEDFNVDVKSEVIKGYKSEKYYIQNNIEKKGKYKDEIKVEYILKSIVTLNNEKITIEFRNEKNSPPSEDSPPSNEIIDTCYLDNFIKIELNEEINLQDLSIFDNFKKDEANIILRFTTNNHIQIVIENRNIEPQIIKNLSYEGLKFDEPRKLIFNPIYIKDVLKIASIKNFKIDKTIKYSPLFIENEKFIFLVMPKKY
jgi:hypothetical protein